jgi:hypothetical protein
LTATVDSTVVIAMFSSTDDDTWVKVTAGMTQAPPAYTGLQNISGSDNSIEILYMIQQAKGTTGTMVAKQTVKGPDAGSYRTAVFK